MAINVVEITSDQARRLLGNCEGHFLDFKAIEIGPAKLTKTISGFANADGGELFVGIDDLKKGGVATWRGFAKPEDANAHMQVFETLFPLGQDFSYEFLSVPGVPGMVLHALIHKTRDIKIASDRLPYVRRGAQNLPVDTDEKRRRLELDKGITSFESDTVSVAPDTITNSVAIIEFMLSVIPSADPEPWLRKQQVLRADKPTVAGVLLFSDEPQAILPKRCGIKIYRYGTKDKAGTREVLVFDPITVEGCLYKQIKEAVERTVAIVEELPILGKEGFEKVTYPRETLHEIITNAVLHRDYSIADDVHVRIFDNRIEVESPGRLPGHVTPENILDERFARNGQIVRLINKFPDPPNKDVGEGLNTAFEAMRQLELREPVIEERVNSVLVHIRHERLASPEVLVMEYLQDHDQINNTAAREICHIGSENRMKRIFDKLIEKDLIERIPELKGNKTAYRKKAR
jgi:ATP-dependent DNA helicase RecG